MHRGQNLSLIHSVLPDGSLGPQLHLYPVHAIWVSQFRTLRKPWTPTTFC